MQRCDNSPTGHAEDVMHAYTTPGTYIATLTVCDKENSCDTDTREVTIRKRNGPSTATRCLPPGAKKPTKCS